MPRSPERRRRDDVRSRSRSPVERHRARARDEDRVESDRHRGRSRSPSRDRRHRRDRDRRSRSRSRDRSSRRRRSQSPDRRHRRSSRRDDYSTDSAESGSDSYSSYSSDSDREERRKSSKKERKRSKDKKRKSKKHKKDKKRKKEPKISGVVGDEFGKYGIIRETDIYNKEQEFHEWLIQVKHLSPETLNQLQMKQHFRGYMEDYNTASFPHEKYYNLDKWEKSQYASEDAWGQKMKGSGGESVGAFGSLNLLRDEEQLRRQRRTAERLAAAAPTMTKEQVEELRRVQSDRVAAEKLRKMGYQPKESMGVRYESSLQ